LPLRPAAWVSHSMYIFTLKMVSPINKWNLLKLKKL
ncbi:hypothetical protein LEMLEM_LOCUS2959, partial [Lemmus lemmus]